MPAFSHIDQQFANGDTKPRLSVIGCENELVIPVVLEQVESVKTYYEQKNHYLQKENNNLTLLIDMLNSSNEFRLYQRKTKNGNFELIEGAKIILDASIKRAIRDKFEHNGNFTEEIIQLKPRGWWWSVRKAGEKLGVSNYWYDIAYENELGDIIVLDALRR